MAKTKMDPTLKIVIIIIAVFTAIPVLLVIIGIILVLLTGNMYSGYIDTKYSETTNTIEQNNAIVDQAIQQKDPAVCDQIKGETSVNMPLPGGNKVQTYDETTSKQRCKAQAEAGQPYVY